MKRIGILGAGGFTGQELLSLLANHSQCRVDYITSNEYADRALSEVFPRLANPKYANLKFSHHPQSIGDAPSLDVVFLATPDSASLEWAPQFVNREVRVIDIAGAFRLKNATEFHDYYGIEHDQPELLTRAVYGMAEIHRDDIKNAKIVANAGCYPAAAILPLWAIRDLLPEFQGAIIADAKSGTSGAGGRKEKDSLGYSTVNENFRAYKIEHHQHTPEIKQEVHGFGGEHLGVRFTPHLLPLFRGILNTSYLTPKGDVADIEKKVETALKKAADENTFLRYYENPNDIAIRNVQHSNYVDIAFHADKKNNVLMIISALDNLLKGAAGSAVQNMNIMFGFDEGEALI